MSKHVTFGAIPNDIPTVNQAKKTYISDSLQRIQNMVKYDNAETFMFNLDRSKEFAKVLETSICENDILAINVDGKSFKDVYIKMTPKMISKHMTIKKYLNLILSDELEQMAEELMWIVIFDTLQARSLTKVLRHTRKHLYNVLSMHFSSFRKSLSLLPATTYDRITEFYCAQICAVILILLLHSHQDSELFSSVAFVGKIENRVRMLFIGFASPNINSFHSIVFDLIPKSLKASVPTKMIIGGDNYDADLTTTISYEPQIANEWNSRRECLFQATSQTGLMANALKLRGTSAPQPTKSHRVVRGSVGKSELPIRKAMNIMKSVDDIVGEHIDDTKMRLDELKDFERGYFESPRWSNLNATFMPNSTAPQTSHSSTFHSIIAPKPLGFTFDNFQPDTSLPGVFQELARSPRRYKLDNMPLKQPYTIDIPKMQAELEAARIELHDELRDSQQEQRLREKRKRMRMLQQFV